MSIVVNEFLIPSCNTKNEVPHWLQCDKSLLSIVSIIFTIQWHSHLGQWTILLNFVLTYTFFRTVRL